MIVAPLLAYEALRRRRVREVFAALAVAFGALGEAIEMSPPAPPGTTFIAITGDQGTTR